MDLYSRLVFLDTLFYELEITPGRNDKLEAIKNAQKSGRVAKDDLMFAFEVLAGRHKLGYTFITKNADDDINELNLSTASLREVMQPAFESGKAYDDVMRIAYMYRGLGFVLEPLMNRTLKVGILSSILPKEVISPMLAKKFMPDKTRLHKNEEYYITEKIDGNRCIAKYSIDDERWEFFSRSGKPLKVDFDMTGFPTEHIYDGEIISRDQMHSPSQENFNTLSGIINSKTGDKNTLIYLIFDIMSKITYEKRSLKLRGIIPQNPRVFILPILRKCDSKGLIENADELLKEITDRGGEGIMINRGNSPYEHKRSDAIYKYKKVFSMDMEVVGLIPGTGKNEGLVGSLRCIASAENGQLLYECNVGSGLTDYQRILWANNPSLIMNKIVEVEYFSISQDEASRGTGYYSLRFPRFKGIREDKTETSTF